MSSWFTRAFGYGLGVSVGRALFGDDERRNPKGPPEPIKQQTEEEIRADEKRYDEEAKALEAQAEPSKTPGPA